MFGKYTKIQKKPLSDAAKQCMRYIYPLFFAVGKGDVSVFRELVEHDPLSVDATGRSNAPILFETFLARNLQMAEILLEYGAKPDVIIPFLHPPRLLIVQAITCSDIDFIKLLIQHGASVDKEENGLSARKLLDNPRQYIQLLFKDGEYSSGAQRFLEKAQEMKDLVEQLCPRPTLRVNTPMGSGHSIIFTTSQIRQRGSATSPSSSSTPPLPVSTI